MELAVHKLKICIIYLQATRAVKPLHGQLTVQCLMVGQIKSSGEQATKALILVEQKKKPYLLKEGRALGKSTYYLLSDSLLGNLLGNH
ncbi:MAG: hypothetical protein AB8E15_08045 [Bdellovibrionales bacterium]